MQERNKLCADYETPYEMQNLINQIQQSHTNIDNMLDDAVKNS